LYFGVNAQAQRSAMSSARAALADGDSVTLVQVVDGDTLLVRNPLGEPLSIRLVGVKSFPLTKEAPEVFRAGREAVTQLERLIGERGAVVSLHSTPRDSHGRFLAYLSVEGQDLGLELVKSGAVLAYTLYPFDRRDLYVGAQELARSRRVGLWQSEALVRRADGLLQNWRMKE
jgi:endonuclease YncB( thermonuclease family)